MGRNHFLLQILGALEMIPNWSKLERSDRRLWFVRLGREIRIQCLFLACTAASLVGEITSPGPRQLLSTGKRSHSVQLIYSSVLNKVRYEQTAVYDF